MSKDLNLLGVRFSKSQKELGESNAQNVLFERQSHNLTNELGKLRAKLAVADDNRAGWNKLKIGTFGVTLLNFFIYDLPICTYIEK